ncbi:MAG: putative lipid II flippase FtsW [Actinomycetota bacterium]|nr:putative lipid II flippase FtsW [Actinomycetota bacterium]
MAAAASSARPGRSRSAARPRVRKRPVEYSILYTATLCLLAAGAVMGYSASSAEAVLGGSGDASAYLKRYVMFGLAGLGVMYVLSRRGLALVREATPAFLLASLFLCLLVMVPGFGVTVNGATRWLGAGPLQFQPSELLKLALILFTVRLVAERPKTVQTLKGLSRPLLLVVGISCALLMKQPDMGTTMVICFAIGAILIAAGTPVRHLATMVGGLAALAIPLAIFEPYRMERITSFLDPFKDAGDSGFQAVQALTAIGSGGLFGVGLGESVQKIFYLPEAHTDMILAIIGEELGLVGIFGVVALYGMIGYAGLRTAKAARDPYSKLLAAGITSLIMCQATLNFFAVLGMAPLTGVPLPFISYGATNLIVLLGGMGLLLNIADTGGVTVKARTPFDVIEGGRNGQDRDSRGRDGRARGAGPGRRGRATG